MLMTNLFAIEMQGSLIHSISDCLSEVKCWLANNFLQLNENKSEFILFGKRDV